MTFYVELSTEKLRHNQQGLHASYNNEMSAIDNDHQRLVETITVREQNVVGRDGSIINVSFCKSCHVFRTIIMEDNRIEQNLK